MSVSDVVFMARGQEPLAEVSGWPTALPAEQVAHWPAADLAQLIELLGGLADDVEAQP